MPSERYYKLSGEKQQRIIEASMDEFIREGYQEASINQIIKEADISRGSFYTYFVDKDDLFGFIFKKFKRMAGKTILSAVKQNQGDIFKACRELMKVAMKLKEVYDDKSIKFYEKIMSDMSIMKHITKDLCNKKPDFSELTELIDNIYADMNDLKNCLTRQEFDGIVDMLITMSVKALVTVNQDHTLREETLDRLFYQYDIIERGIRGGK